MYGCGGGGIDTSNAAPQAETREPALGTLANPITSPNGNLDQDTKIALSKLKVLSINKVSESRIDRTTFEYQFSVTVKSEASQSFDNVIIQLTKVGQGSSIIQGEISLGTVVPASTTVSNKNLIIRHNRALPFQQEQINLTISATPSIIADSVAGTDADGNGVRDDVDDFINQRHPGKTASTRASLQLAGAYQSSALAKTTDEVEAAVRSRVASAACLVLRMTPSQAEEEIILVRAKQLNNLARIEAERAFRNKIGNRTIAAPSDLTGECK